MSRLRVFWVAIGLIIAYGLFDQVGDRSGGESRRSADPAASDRGQSVRPPRPLSVDEARAKVADGAIFLMSGDRYPKTLAKLGRAAFDRANALTPWAALVAAADHRCDQVQLAEVSDQATAERLVWFVDCANQERYYVSEQEARDAKAASAPRPTFKPVGASEPEAVVLRDQLPLPSADPENAKLTSFREVEAVTACDLATQRQLQIPNSYDSAWTWTVMQHKQNGRATIFRNFTAKNVFNAELQHHYRCLVDADTNSVLELSIFEGPR